MKNSEMGENKKKKQKTNEDSYDDSVYTININTKLRWIPTWFATHIQRVIIENKKIKKRRNNINANGSYFT